MKNKIIIMILALISLISFNALDVKALSAPSSVKVKSKSELYYYTEKKKTDYISGYNFYRKELTDGTFVYCVSNINTTVPAGKTLNLKGEITDAGLSYILQNGYPYKSFTGNAKKDYYITQSAVWWYFDQTRGSNNWKSTKFTANDTGMKKYVYELVEAAKVSNSSEVASPSVDLVVVDTKMTLSNDNNYYVSSPIRVSTDSTSKKATISLKNAPDGTLVKNASGEVKTTFKNGEEFYVYTPVSSVSQSGNLKVVATSKSNVTKSYLYSSGQSGVQDIGLVVTETLKTSTNITLKYELVVKTKLKISKQDITSKEELPGATLILKDKSGKVIETWVSTNEPKYIEGLTPGTYTLTEKIAPVGYVLSSETITFTLKADGNVKTVVMYNSKEVITKVKISKQDITSKAELPGATLILKDKSGKVVETWVSTNEPRYITGLTPGEYILTETIAPNGYKLSSETITFTVLNDGTVTSVVMYNEKYGVPITDLNISSGTVVGAALIMLLGTGLVFYAKHSYEK